MEDSEGMGKVGRFISIGISLVFGVVVYFLIRGVLIEEGQANLVPLLTVGIILALPIAIAIVHWEDKLMSIRLVSIPVRFFKRTQWLWFATVVVAIVVLNII